MNALLRCVFLLAASAPLLAGCGKMRNVQIETVSCQQWDEALALQKGKIVVVDTWATWCIPCTEDFPKLVALQEKYAPRNVAFMSVSVDAMENRAAALEFLKRHEAAFANYLIDDKENAWYDKWKIKGIPVVLVFDGEGKLVKKFDMDDPDNQFTYSDVDKFLAQLLE
jgi:thiol-disulfide isomerase/thioredoxin